MAKNTKNRENGDFEPPDLRNPTRYRHPVSSLSWSSTRSLNLQSFIPIPILDFARGNTRHANPEFSTNLRFVNFACIQRNNLAEICIQMVYIKYETNWYQQSPVSRTFLSHTVTEIQRSQDQQFLRKLDKLDRGQLQWLTPPLNVEQRESVGASKCRSSIDASNHEV